LGYGLIATMTTDPLALDFKSAALYAIRIVLHSADLTRLNAALDQRMADAGSFFANEPVVIDASRVTEDIDWPALLEALRQHNLPPIGVVAQGTNLDTAQAAGLTPVELSVHTARSASSFEQAGANHPAAPMPQTPATDLVVTNETSSAEHPSPEALPPAPPAALVITKPLRSGQRIYARHTDLVIVGMVSQGAEVIADGNIHVYGPLRGKAMAGARGDTSARIFTTQLDPELIAIAGVYRVVEAKLDNSLHNQAAVIYLDGEALRVEALKK
jgi:septum site-determining protein MinC